MLVALDIVLAEKHMPCFNAFLCLSQQNTYGKQEVCVSKNTYDVIVVGGGIMGTAAAYYLAAEGVSVLLLEQSHIGHEGGSSHGKSRIFHFAYADRRDVRFAKQSKHLWQDFERVTNAQLLKFTGGGIDIGEGPEGRDAVIKIANALDEEECRWEMLDGREMEDRYPQWFLRDNVIAVYSPDAGILNPTECVKIFADHAARRGADVRWYQDVQHILPGQHVAVVTQNGCVFSSAHLVLTPGAWAGPLLARVGMCVPLTVTQEQTVYFRPLRNAVSFSPERFPVWLYHGYHGNKFVYGFPIADHPGVKVAFHHDGPATSVDAYHREPRDGVTERLRMFLAEHLPDAAGEAFEEKTCLYTNSPDERFIIDVAPGYPNVVIGAGGSGHAFKFGTGIGKALCDLTLRGRTDMEISHCRLDRFSKAQPY